MKKKLAFFGILLFFVSCVSLTGGSTTPTPQEKKAQQKQALKDRLQRTMSEQNHVIDSLIAAKDSRLKKDKNGKYIRPNWVSNSGTPLYYSTNKRSSRKAIKADALAPTGTLGLSLNGDGIHIGIWDAGHIFAAHDEFTGGTNFNGYQVPIEIADSTAANIWHGHPTSVASIILAKGILENDNFDISGIAPQLAKVYSYDWHRDVYEIFEQLQTNNNTDFILSNHSYGIPLLDENNSLLLESEEIGGYSLWSSFIDQIAFAYPNYLHVLAAGNDGYKSYPSQAVAGLDQLTGSTTAKNVLTVGSFSMNNNSENFTATGFSSAGPTNDFRIKPEICAAGQNLGAAIWDKNNPEATNNYVASSGTSFASPGAAAAVALLQQLYKQTHNGYMRGATVKALLCHTADDISQWGDLDITGPDTKTGYGAINMEKAAALIQKDADESNTIVEFELNERETKTLYFQSLNQGTLTATLSWYDPQAEENATNTLVNDLDLRIIQNNTTYFPWKLPTDVQQTVAVLGDNSADNLEHINISENLGGAYKIEISHKGTLINRSQDFSLILSGPGLVVTNEESLTEISKNNFLLAPMPAEAYFTVTAVNNKLPFRGLRLLSISGSEVKRTTKDVFSLSSLRFDVSYLASGRYILEIETPSGNIFKHVLIR
ncbi:MAG: S8 family serine peptidase [Bacteroidetes bacterium]|nr:S8 family serine peptidase [Bacteroidota bacterium]